MPCITLPIDSAFRPTVELGISAAASLLPKGSPPPPIHWVSAIADTGCSHTSVHTSIATKSGLKVLGKGSTHTANGTVNCNLFHGDLFIKIPLANGQVFEYPFKDRRIVELMVPIPSVDALMGMDLLMLGTLHVNGITKNAMFCW
jgi:hypothetical protein